MAHTLTLHERKELKITGVTAVNAYDETMLEAQTEAGLLYLEGEGLHVTRFAEDEGLLQLTGQIHMICYRTDTPEKRRGAFSLFGR